MCNYVKIENVFFSFGKRENSIFAQENSQLVLRTPQLLPSPLNKSFECRIDKYFSPERPPTNLKCQVFPHIKSFSLKSNQFIFEKNRRLNLHGTSNDHEIYNSSSEKSSIDTKNFKPVISLFYNNLLTIIEQFLNNILLIK